MIALVALSALGAEMPMADAAVVGPLAHSATPSWRLAKTFGPCVSGLAGITATGPNDAWSTGFQSCGKIGLLIARWDGRSWRRLPPPRLYAGGSGDAVAAISTQYAWSFADNGSSGVALLWQHGRARAYALPGAGIAHLAVAFSRSDAWAFGRVSNLADSPSLAARWNGRAWIRESVPVAPVGLAAPGPRNIWVVGAQANQAGQPMALAHWTGRWQTIPFGLPSDWFVLSVSVVADNSSGAWVLADVLDVSPDSEFGLLLHWTGSTWSRVRVPYQVEYKGPLAHDGHGGLWLAAHPTACNNCLATGIDMIHYSAAGTWTRVFVPVPGESVDVAAMRLIPGTRSVWAAGQIGPPEALAAIFKYGP